jgi:hypothetical protein
MHQQMTSNHLLYDLLVYKIGFRFNYLFFHVNLMSIWLYNKSFNKNSFQSHCIVLVSFIRPFDGIKWSNTTSFLFGYLFIWFQYATQNIWNSWGWECEGECGCDDIYDSHRSVKHPHTHPQLKPRYFWFFSSHNLSYSAGKIYVICFARECTPALFCVLRSKFMTNR